MKCDAAHISGPYRHDNLTVLLTHGSSSAEARRYAVRQQALPQKKVIVRETGTSGELIIENLIKDKDAIIQTGKILRGGRQARTRRVDLVVPARAKIPFPSFCVESARWHRRGRESAELFRRADHYLSTEKVKLAARQHASQGAVWNKVAGAQVKFSKSIGSPVYSPVSTSSFELAVDHDQPSRRRQDAVQNRQSLRADYPAPTGFGCAINGRFSRTGIYARHDSFAVKRPKLIKSTMRQALAEQTQTPDHPATTKAEMRALLGNAERVPSQSHSISVHVTAHVKHNTQTPRFETGDHALPETQRDRHYIRDSDEPILRSPTSPAHPGSPRRTDRFRNNGLAPIGNDFG